MTSFTGVKTVKSKDKWLIYFKIVTNKLQFLSSKLLDFDFLLGEKSQIRDGNANEQPQITPDLAHQIQQWVNGFFNVFKDFSVEVKVETTSRPIEVQFVFASDVDAKE